MANLDAPLGFSPVKNRLGTTVPVEVFNLVGSDNCAPGTVVYLSDAGVVVPYTGTATGRTQLLGVTLGYVSTSQTDRAVLVTVDPEQEYEVQVDDNSLTALTDMLGANFAGTNLAVVHTTLIQSRGEIDGNTGTSINNSTTIRPFKALRFSRTVDDDQTQSFTRIIVKINPTNHILAAGAAGVL